MTIRPRKEDAQIESAITFMVEKINKYNRNPKPLILHSLRVGLRLYEKGESTKIVIAGLLHDLLEDTKCTEQEIEKAFGTDMLRFVSVFNFDDPYMRYEKRWTVAVQKMLEIGRDAAIVKLVDIHDNLRSLGLQGKDEEMTKGFIWRHELIRNSFKTILQDDADYQAYRVDLEQMEKALVSSGDNNKEKK